MKSGKLMCVTTTALLAALAVPAMLAAHDNKDLGFVTASKLKMLYTGIGSN
jgi:hypothetical protein